MPQKTSSDLIILCHEDTQIIRDALAHGQVDAILPAVNSFVDRFHEFSLSCGLFPFLETLPDARQRRSVPAFFYGNVLLHKELLGLPKFADIGNTLFHSPAVLRSLGFNFRCINDGYYQNANVKPFDQEALCDFFAELSPEDLLRHYEPFAVHLRNHFPVLQKSRLALMDGFDVKVRRCRPGSDETTEDVHYKFCVLALQADGEIFPLLWNYCLGQEKNDLTLGKALLEKAFRLFGDTPFDHLLVDRGFLDGAWMAHLKQDHKVDTVIALREDMQILDDLIGLSRGEDVQWLEADPPRLHNHEIPERHLAGFSDLTTWDSYAAPLNACLVRDTYSDGVVYQGIVCTDRTLSCQKLHSLKRQRWEEEEGFMTLSRYWGMNHVGPCRPVVGFCQAHMTFIAYTLMGLFRRFEAEQNKEATKPILVAGREVVVYWRNYYAILYPSDVIQIVLDHVDVWLDKKDHILATLRYAEGRGPARHPP